MAWIVRALFTINVDAFGDVFLLYLWGSLLTLIAYQPYTLVGSLEVNPPSCDAPRQPTIHVRIDTHEIHISRLYYQVIKPSRKKSFSRLLGFFLYYVISIVTNAILLTTKK